MGAVAFVLLIGAEFAVSIFLFDQTSAQFIAGFHRPAGIIGLAAQLLFGLLPLLYFELHRMRGTDAEQ